MVKSCEKWFFTAPYYKRVTTALSAPASLRTPLRYLFLRLQDLVEQFLMGFNLLLAAYDTQVAVR